MESLQVKVKNFEGPFDLLLHLIRKNKMDIYNIQIHEITNQYLEYLDEMREMDLEITSEFVVTAAALIEIKSKHLLPKPKKEIVEDDEEDTEKQLLEKLAVYRKIKNASVFFKERCIDTGELYSKKPEIIEEIKTPEDNKDIFKNITLLELYKMYNKIIESYNKKQNKTNVVQRKIYVDRYKIEDKMEYIKNSMEAGQTIYFNELIQESECKLETIVTFLAVLEMIKLKNIKVYQQNNFGSILIEMREKNNE